MFKALANKSLIRVNKSWTIITPGELAEHNNVDGKDAWMSIRGVVYDVSEYAASHPGGIEKIRKFAGKDATEVFNEVHGYVDVVGILGEYRLGVLEGHPDAPKKTLLTMLKCPGCCTGHRYKFPTTWFKQDSIVVTYYVEFQAQSNEMDWTVGVIDKQFLHVYKLLDRVKAWLSIHELPEPLINDRAKMEFKNGYKLLEITFRKPVPGTSWGNQLYGLGDKGQIASITEVHAKFDAFIIFKKCLSYNVIIFGIEVTASARIHVPIGLDVNIHVGDKFRPYTPVYFNLIDYDHNLPEKQAEEPPTVLYFMIKIYSKGEVTSKLDAIEIDVGKEIPTLQISSPYGSFNDAFIDDYNTILLIAAGTGITPMIKIIRKLFETHRGDSSKRVGFVYFCAKIHDLIWRKQFTNLEGDTNWFLYFPVLTKPSSYCRWQGLTGRITPEMMGTIMNDIPSSRRGIQKACVCGPPGFNSATVNSLKGVVPLESIYVFSRKKV